MYTYLYANEKLNIPTENLRIVSVGSTLENSDTIKADSSLLKWASRLSGMQGPVKMQTMDYMTQYLMKQKEHVFYKFTLPMNRDQLQSLFWLNKRLPTLKHLSEKMVSENEIMLTNLLTDLVKDKFGYNNSCDAKAQCSKDVKKGGDCKTAGASCGYGLTCTKTGMDL